jgi:hypothetical protein
MTRPELVFLHIPKTAGTSQLNAFSQYYGAGNVFCISGLRPEVASAAM